MSRSVLFTRFHIPYCGMCSTAGTTTTSVPPFSSTTHPRQAAKLNGSSTNATTAEEDTVYPEEKPFELKFQFKKRMKSIARANGLSPKFAYQDIATCPVCLQVETKPVEEWTEREIKHLSHHVAAPVVEDVLIHCIHFIHGIPFCCKCDRYSPPRLTLEGLLIRELG